jgi:hypothetical protein
MIRLPTYLKSSCLKWGRDLRLEVHRIRSGASEDLLGDVGCLDFRAPYRNLVVDVTVTSARTNTSVPHVGARLPLPGSLALGAQHGKLDADLCTSALLGTPRFIRPMTTTPSLRRMGAGLRLWRLSWMIGCIFWWQLVASLALVMQTLIHRGMTLMSACNISFVDLLLFLAAVFCGMHLMREFIKARDQPSMHRR